MKSTLILVTLFLLMSFSSRAATERVTVSLTGGEPNGSSVVNDITPNGRYIVFTTGASDLITGDTNNKQDVYLYNTESDTLEIVSVTDGEALANGDSYEASISDDGRYVSFTSTATNLADTDTNAATDVFLRDRTLGTTTRISRSSAGAQANGNSSRSAISGDGSTVAFESAATNLVAGDLNDATDIFIHVPSSNTTSRVSLSDAEAEIALDSNRAAISSDGNIVVFETYAAVVAGDTNDTSDIYVRNRSAETTIRASIGAAGQQSPNFCAFPDISGDGNLVVFSSRSTTFGLATARTRIYLKNLTTGAIEHLSVATSGVDGSNDSDGPRISANGRYVIFGTRSPELVSGDSNGVDDVVVRDRTLSTTTRVSVSSTGAQSFPPLFTYLGQLFYASDVGLVAFHSQATDLVTVSPADTLGLVDVFTATVPTSGPVTPPPVDNSALIAKYKAEIAKLLKQIKSAKKKKKTATVKKLTKKLKSVQGLLNAL